MTIMIKDTGKRGSGRTHARLTEAWKASQDPASGPKLVFFVVHDRKSDDYNFKMLVKIAGKEGIQEYSMSAREVRFKNGGRVRFVTLDDPFLGTDDRGRWHVSGYRRDLPIIWDHFAEDVMTDRGIAKNSPELDLKHQGIVYGPPKK